MASSDQSGKTDLGGSLVFLVLIIYARDVDNLGTDAVRRPFIALWLLLTPTCGNLQITLWRCKECATAVAGQRTIQLIKTEFKEFQLERKLECRSQKMKDLRRWRKHDGGVGKRPLSPTLKHPLDTSSLAPRERCGNLAASSWHNGENAEQTRYNRRTRWWQTSDT